MNNYVPLDGATPSFFNQAINFTIGQDAGIFGVASLVLTVFLVASGLAAFVRVLYGIGLIVGPFGDSAEATIRKGKGIISSSLLYLLLTFSLVLIMLAINPDVVTGRVDFRGIRVGQGGAAPGGTISTERSVGSGGGSVSCPNPDSFKTALARGGNVCEGATTCRALAGCNTGLYDGIIATEAARQGVSAALVKVILCRESRGNPAASHTNTNGSTDCGLMQVNVQGASCPAELLNPSANIARGVSLIKQKYNSISQTYQGISREMMVAASYNCCGNGDNPNAPSTDCTTANGFPYSIPKWACPINPGPTNANMCFVRGYSCDIAACLQELSQ